MNIYRAYFKSFCDFCIALFLLICFMPIFIFIAFLIKIDDFAGPVFFRQKRGGMGGGFFDILKFRSMKPKEKKDGKDFDPGDSMRVTSVGKILRKTKLDELPQLINVLRGEMSLVGPRPEVRRYIELYPERWEKVLSVKPGITDPASIVYRDEEEILAAVEDPEKEYCDNLLPRKLDLYEQYVDSISLSGDFIILVKTFLVVLTGKGSASG